LRDILHRIQEVNGIQRTETFISLEEGIERPIAIENTDHKILIEPKD